MASELKLDMRSDGYVKVQDLLKLKLKTFANIPLHIHTVDDVREVCSFISVYKSNVKNSYQVQYVVYVYVLLTTFSW